MKLPTGKLISGHFLHSVLQGGRLCRETIVNHRQSGVRSFLATRWTAPTLLAVCMVIATSGGCSRYAVTSNRLLPEEKNKAAQTILTRSDQGAVLKAMASIGESSSSPRSLAAKHGMRWSDVDNAVFYAVAETEMAITSRTEYEWGFEYQLLTIEEYPGTLRIIRTDDERVYDAAATIGRVVNQPQRAAALVEELRKQMIAFGRKPSLAGD